MAIRTEAIEKIRPAPEFSLVDRSKNASVKKSVGRNLAFDEVFKDRITHKRSIKFSAHAKNRLRSRNINLTLQDLNRIEKAVSKASNKGADESLLIMDNLALIVSIKNRTVITAIDGNNLIGNVFTNIDSAVIIGQT